MPHVSLNGLPALWSLRQPLISGLTFQGSRRTRRDARSPWSAHESSGAKKILLLREQEERPSLESGASAASARAGVLRQGHPQAERCLFAFLLWKSNFFDEIQLGFLSHMQALHTRWGVALQVQQAGCMDISMLRRLCWQASLKHA